MNVIFYPVGSPKDKVRFLVRTATDHFLRKEPLRIEVPDEKTARFVENLLLQVPEEGFLPVSLFSPDPFADLLLIGLQEEAGFSPFLFNLCEEPKSPSPLLKTVYELEDLSRPEKKKIFEAKFQTYRDRGYPISSGSSASRP